MAEFDWNVMFELDSENEPSYAWLLPESYVRGSGYTDDISILTSKDPNKEYWMYATEDDFCAF